ncbi:MAG: hypothetical protein GC189_05145 [Alphaproteobacteria bacterium]|nr:hypothetical protein [Alphaproteobacteria bacterium]
MSKQRRTPNPASPFERAYDALMARAAGAGAGAAKAARQAGAIALNRDPARAQAAFARAAALDPLHAQTQLAMARLALERGDPALARTLAGEAFDLSDDDAARGLAAFALGEIAVLQRHAQAAREAFEAALALQEGRALAQPDDADARRHAARCRQRLAELEDDPQTRRTAHQDALTALEALPLARCGPGLLEDVAFGHARLAALARTSDDAAAARAHLAAARGCFERLSAAEPDEPAWRGEITDALRMESALALDAGDPAAARATADDSVRLALALAAARPDAVVRRAALARSWTALAHAALAQSDVKTARQAAEQACALLTPLIESAQTSEDAAIAYGQAQLARSAALFAHGDLDEARAAAAHVRAAIEPSAARGDADHVRLLAQAWAQLGEIAMRVRKPDAARDAFARAAAFDAGLGGGEAAALQENVALACAQCGDVRAARDAWAASADAWLKRVQGSPQRRDGVWGLTRALDRLGSAHLDLGDHRGATNAWRDALEMADILCEQNESAALRMRARLCAALYERDPRPGNPLRAKALNALETLARQNALTAEDVELQSRILSVR